ncbi:Dimethyladenosine transferase; AltName: Full=18S rRNA (adenine(1779)-N(6)/adenine(1780)-N(6))-dimethyltransferase; AltName: Full=18S rRNA dimethylase; AltName: Full=S-adenosylmethionine-6-N', N'-adenosyl(rRNA) dimethyltransferase [Serendipita indica DSM 11827]|nr:Dimethyladenosine transferase; AltName: Full=18S rRNA (adenine(1779)-N(6)/adenine(1780)-N(6))-dimethyltransferase; AltName: Full=18S rRNA dimethylase; AltName: Full=S-adenosylmethionine-6-N', N'-adenosyl(rRNA) dimethyltransferase [Serendipita indica DSM 11827]
MPRATSEKFARLHQAAAKSNKAPTTLQVGGSSKGYQTASGSGSTSKSSGAGNPLFNTERFGQHILKNKAVAQAIVEKANLKPTDSVLEVGPGTGNLTVLILEKAKHVTAVEADPRMAAELVKRVQGTPEQRKLDITVGDFVKAELPFFDVCISNTPYQISSPLVFRLLSHRPLPRVAILMFQREFALRLTATPGTEFWSRLSANVQLYAKVDHIMKVSRNNFIPPPNVESSVVRITPLSPPPPVRFEEFDGLTRILFTRRNKTCRANFQASGVEKMMKDNWSQWKREQKAQGKTSMDVDEEDTIDAKEAIEEILTKSGFSDARPAKMTVDDLLKLLHAFHARGFHFA